MDLDHSFLPVPSAVNACAFESFVRQEQGTFLFPLGTNGHYISAAKFVNASTLTIPTTFSSGFKIEPKVLAFLRNSERF